MCRRLTLAVVLGLLAAFPAAVPAQELLTNGGLEFEFDTFRNSVPDGWEMEEGPMVPELPGPYPGDYNDGGVTMPCRLEGCGAIDAADYTVWRNHFGGGPFQLPNEVLGTSTGLVTMSDYVKWKELYGGPYPLSLAEPSNFHLLEADWNMWFQPYNSTRTENAGAIADNFAHLTQTVDGIAGMEYTMSAYALFENYFPGGVVNLNDGTGEFPGTAPFNDGPVSPTDTYFALEFLDSVGAVLPGSIVDYELMAHGQPVNPGGNASWMQHTLVAVAPVGTDSVRVRASMINGVLNPLPCNECFEQSFFVDAFSLTAAVPGGGGTSTVPEPASWLLSAIVLGGCAMRRPAGSTRRQ